MTTVAHWYFPLLMCMLGDVSRNGIGNVLLHGTPSMEKVWFLQGTVALLMTEYRNGLNVEMSGAIFNQFIFIEGLLLGVQLLQCL